MPGAVLCLPGRGPFDALAAVMLGQVLQRRGFGVRIGGLAAGPGGAAEAAVPLPDRGRQQRGDGAVPAAPGAAAAAGDPGPGAGLGAGGRDGTLAAALKTEGQTTPLLLAGSLAEALDLAVEQAGAGRAAGADRAGAAARGAPALPREEPGLGVVTAPA